MPARGSEDDDAIIDPYQGGEAIAESLMFGLLLDEQVDLERLIREHSQAQRRSRTTGLPAPRPALQ